MAIAFVDVDGTLLTGRSSELTFATHLLLSGRLGPRQLAEGVAFFSRWGRRLGIATVRKNKAYLAGLEVAAIERFARRVTAERLLPRLRASVVARINEHRRAGETVALLTGAPQFLAAPLAEAVGADLCCATLCAVRDGVFAPEPPQRHPFGACKVREARRIAAERGVELAACAAYGDAIHDLPLLESVSRPVVVAPGPCLRRIARRRGWEVLGEEAAG